MEELEGINILGKNLTNLRFADDIVLLAGIEESLQNKLHQLSLESNKVGLIINANKNKVMANSPIKKLKLLTTPKSKLSMKSFTLCRSFPFPTKHVRK